MAVAEPNTPIDFDFDLNEYHVVTKEGGHMMIYYCPICGGRTPETKRSSLWAKVTVAERHRLVELTRHIRTHDDVLATLGQPDQDEETQVVLLKPEPSTTVRFRKLTYTRLSDIAEVHVHVFSPNQIQLRFQEKYIGKLPRENPT